MLTKIMTWLSVAALGVAVLSQSTIRDIGISGWVVCAGAIVVLIRAVRMRQYYWTAGLIAIAVLFNPVTPVPVSPATILGLDLACILAFLVSLSALRPHPILSIASITGRTPGSESL